MMLTRPRRHGRT